MIFSWRGNESDENENDRPRPSGGSSLDNRRGQNRDFGSGNRD